MFWAVLSNAAERIRLPDFTAVGSVQRSMAESSFGEIALIMMTMPAHAQPLDSYHWQYRPLLVFTPGDDNALSRDWIKAGGTKTLRLRRSSP